MRAVGEDEVGADSGEVLAAFLEGEEGRGGDGEDGAAGSEADDLEWLEVVGWGKGIGKWEERVKGEGALEELGESRRSHHLLHLEVGRWGRRCLILRYRCGRRW